MIERDAERFLSKLPASVVLPAGCGKTELVAATGRVAESQSKRTLVLTHTNAGVEVLRRRLNRYGVSPQAVTVQTIDSWCRYLTEQFPALASVNAAANNPYEERCLGAVRVLAAAHVQHILQLTYPYIIVDEYQDTNLVQHSVVLAMRSIVPVGVLGDPLQGIFDWASSRIIDWDHDVLSNFAPIEVESYPWRWEGHNEALGEWLVEARNLLLQRRPLSFDNKPFLEWRVNQPGIQRRVCFEQLSYNGTVTALHNTPNQCHAFGRSLGGRYGVMEELDCRVLKELATALDTGAGPATAAALLSFARQCATGLSKPLDDVQVTALSSGRVPRSRPGSKPAAAIQALAAVIASPDAQHARLTLDAISAVDGVRIFRKEAWHEARRSMDLWQRSPDTKFSACVETTRNRTRIVGRLAERCNISRTLLVKGLEYDSCIVLDANGLSARNLYVALTRARDRLTVLSSDPTIAPTRF